MARRRDDDVSLRKIREAVRLRIEATSLRRTAAEINLSPTGLTGFLEGKVAHQTTRAKVVRWYARHSWREGTAATPEAARASLSLLVQHIPGSARPEVAGELVALLARLTDIHGLGRPGWLAEDGAGNLPILLEEPRGEEEGGTRAE